MVVKNEDRFIWYAISSVLPYAKEILVTDTGSSDNTVKLIKSFKTAKVIFEQKTISHPSEIGAIRNKQIEKTETDWFWIVDGDEIYPETLCKEILHIIIKSGETLKGIVVRRFDLLGDIYHYQDENVGSYSLFGQSGHLVLRLFNKKNIPQITVKGIYPYEGYYDDKEKPIIDHTKEKFAVTHGKLFHAMYLERSSKGKALFDTFHRNKFKIETGYRIDKSQIPKVFQRHPAYIADVASGRSRAYQITAAFITPIKRIKRKLWNSLL
ncbi:glycosyltransferase [Candidatus Gottesmanbacteria bacterium]|nr:glycosyltransferase [Candidatus Gottesmanbacteria bacterium]